jgi:hypothetical protein
MKFRFAAVAAPGARVDRESRIIRGVSVIQAGEALGHGLMIDEIMMAQVVAAINATGDIGTKSRFTHPGMCSDAMGKMLGKAKNARVDGDKVLADLYVSQHASKTPDGDLAEYVMAMAEESPEDFGLSIAFDGFAIFKLADGTEMPAQKSEDDGPMPFARLTKLRAVDVVDEPAANRSGLFAAFAATTSADASEMFAAIDELRESAGWSIEKSSEFLSRYIHTRKPQMTNLAEVVPSVAPEDKMCPTCGAPVSSDGKYVPVVAKADPVIAPAAMSALCAAHPADAPLIAQCFADGKPESAILAILAEKRTAALAAQVTQLTTQLAAEVAGHAQTKAKLSKLSALSESPEDPGVLPIGGTPEATTAQLKSAWSAMSKDGQAAFMGEFKNYEHHIIAAKSGAKE